MQSSAILTLRCPPSPLQTFPSEAAAARATTPANPSAAASVPPARAHTLTTQKQPRKPARVSSSRASRMPQQPLAATTAATSTAAARAGALAAAASAALAAAARRVGAARGAGAAAVVAGGALMPLGGATAATASVQAATGGARAAAVAWAVASERHQSWRRPTRPQHNLSCRKAPTRPPAPDQTQVPLNFDHLFDPLDAITNICTQRTHDYYFLH